MSPEKLKDYSEHHAMTYHFPDAYAGSNTKIRDTLNNLILKSPQNWRECRPLNPLYRARTDRPFCVCAETSVGLPFFQIQGTVVEWDEVRFDVRLMQRVPYGALALTRARTPRTRCALTPPFLRALRRGRLAHADVPEAPPQGPCRAPRSGSHH